MNLTPWLQQSDAAARALAEGFAMHITRWVPGVSADVLECAQALSLATSAGHVCLPLRDLVGGLPDATTEGATVERLAAVLLASQAVGLASAPGSLPMVLDPQRRLYLNRYHDLECRLARRILASTRNPPADESNAVLQEMAHWFNTDPHTEDHEQFLAAARAVRQTLTLISGGPGTGKTTTVVNLLAGWLRHAPVCRIALAAPTGKAAARMLEAIRDRSGHLPPELKALLPQQAHTVHRLLGVVPQSSETRYTAEAPLPIDALVVDEASMLDLSLAVKLLEAVPTQARIVFLGDPHQLAAVESGAVFAELTAMPEPLQR
jgi:exodeoxyribonuclease V alpha subunit